MKIKTPAACIEAEEGSIAKVVIMPGDPLRAKYIADNYLENPVCFNTVRNMLGFTGTYKGKRISVMGHGIGIPSAALYAHELYNFYGVESIIRVGSAGALRDELHTKDVVIAMGASTNSNFAHMYQFPGTLAPTANFEMLQDAVAAAKELGATVRVGNVFCSDMFYNKIPDVAQKARDLGMLAVEMETAGLYLQALAENKKALGILSISDHMFRDEALTATEIRESFHEMMLIALETATKYAD
ncbi:MAG: purine-nucleoside phosphorylase [Lachnospiraceae bacterium]|nr:purine-nucleoside phosphorylase [Lachnospiraceae bacterium]